MSWATQSITRDVQGMTKIFGSRPNAIFVQSMSQCSCRPVDPVTAVVLLVMLGSTNGAAAVGEDILTSIAWNLKVHTGDMLRDRRR